MGIIRLQLDFYACFACFIAPFAVVVLLVVVLGACLGSFLMKLFVITYRLRRRSTSLAKSLLYAAATGGTRQQAAGRGRR